MPSTFEPFGPEMSASVALNIPPCPVGTIRSTGRRAQMGRWFMMATVGFAFAVRRAKKKSRDPRDRA